MPCTHVLSSVFTFHQHRHLHSCSLRSPSRAKHCSKHFTLTDLSLLTFKGGAISFCRHTEKATHVPDLELGLKAGSPTPELRLEVMLLHIWNGLFQEPNPEQYRAPHSRPAFQPTAVHPSQLSGTSPRSANGSQSVTVRTLSPLIPLLRVIPRGPPFQPPLTPLPVQTKRLPWAQQCIQSLLNGFHAPWHLTPPALPIQTKWTLTGPPSWNVLASMCLCLCCSLQRASPSSLPSPKPKLGHSSRIASSTKFSLSAHFKN